MSRDFPEGGQLAPQENFIEIAVVEISDFERETLRYCSQRTKPLESNSGSLYVEPFALCPKDCNYSPSNFA